MNFLRDDNSNYIYKKYYDLAHRLYYGQVVKSRFLDPNELNILISIMNSMDLQYQIYGSHSNCERSIIYFSQGQFNLDDYIYEDVAVIYLHKKNHGLGHRDVLGALMSLGIERELIGDILTSDELIEISVLREVADYIRFNLKSIGKLKVDFEEKDDIYMDEGIIEYEEKMITISSLRLDAFISGIANLSRSDSKNMVNRELVKLNYVVEKNPSKEIGIGDCISIRGYGRYYYIEYLGESRKEKERILVRKII